MLQALELYGFKSFADKTRFEFPPGITVIVGPNGSGKSNVVDAIRWVLGEQSARSLRGKEMADVIFKGTGAGGRRMMGAAEATIIFDNRDRRLPVDADEVQVTRRVYRSGEGEYLVNGQPCRLKDIRDMFRGTGVGTDTYSLIEQGKVDQVLQASPRERRLLFEEAAGISRFRAKKVEAQRRLERVDQNLLRLRDIVEELEHRLQILRSQAAKARQYRELTGRLQQLRTEVAWCDWRHLTGRLEQAMAVADEEAQKCSAVNAEREALERQWAELESAGGELERALHQHRETLARRRDQITTRQSLWDLEHARLRELADEVALYGRQSLAAARRRQEAQRRLDELHHQVEQQAAACRRAAEHQQEQQSLLTGLQAQWETLDQQCNACRLQQTDCMQRLTRLGKEHSRLTAELSHQQDALRAAEREVEELSQRRLTLQQRVAQLTDEEARAASHYEAQQVALYQAQQQCAQSRRLLTRRQHDAAQLAARHQAMQEKLAILLDWQQRREGVGPGARQLLQWRDQGNQQIVGMVAELISTEVSMAPMIDVALGEAAQWIVLRHQEFIGQLADQAQPLDGRVHVVALDRLPRRLEHRPARWEGRPGVLGRADRFVHCSPEIQPLAEYLLGRTYIVERLEIAHHCYQQTPGRARFVTLQGELVERDGTVVLGPRHVSEELVSRRMELESLRQQLLAVQELIYQSDSELRSLAENIEQQEQQIRRLSEAERSAHQVLIEKRVALEAARRELAACQERRDRAEQARSQLAEQVAQLSAQVAAMADEIAGAELALRQVEQRLTQLLDQRERVERQRQQQLQVVTKAQIDLSTAEQQLQTLQAQRTQAEETVRERTRAWAEVQSNGQRCQERYRATERLLLNTASELAQLFLEKEASEKALEEKLQQKVQHEARRAEIAKRMQQVQRKHQQAQEQLHRRQLEVEQLRQVRQSLEQRVREDFGVDIARWEGTALADLSVEQRAEMEHEIDTLRRRINQLGAVNLQALEELDELENRYNTLHSQYQDLISAKESLERLIHRINADSRRLFLETLQAVRENFQTIYRKAFGGGRADLILEEGVDPLEAGIDIVATPPGKPSFNNSLLSGGEKALTAVALLLAIFQYRPSPFCVLDEVDAPFDEANIERFIQVLKDFLGRTKFVIVTHSKKTMTAATTLYGVTMQESGVSRRVSVRFDDVSDSGEIAAAALQREAG